MKEAARANISAEQLCDPKPDAEPHADRRDWHKHVAVGGHSFIVMSSMSQVCVPTQACQPVQHSGQAVVVVVLMLHAFSDVPNNCDMRSQHIMCITL